MASTPPASSAGLYDVADPGAEQNSSARITRTVAIIKNHALAHRFDIEPRIQGASFEIVKERQMEFDVETDPETLYELFGEDADSLGEGPVWVYVLERRRAVEVWNTLMGDKDPEVARKETPNSLRALYGISRQQNGLMGSPDSQTAEMQIASLFASSPPFPTSDLPEDRFGTTQSVSSSILDQLRSTTSDEGYAPSNRSTTRDSSSQGGIKFRARPLPATHLKPNIVPRTTRAAALRAGTVSPQKRDLRGGNTAPRQPLTKEEAAKTFANVPGHKRAETVTVASTAAPTVAPRMTKAAALRMGIVPEEPKKKSAENGVAGRPSTISKGSTFEGVPGHKRRESIAVASTAAPTVAPRSNKSASLRANKEAGPPSSYMFRQPPKGPGLSRSNSASSLSPNKPSMSRPASQMSLKAGPSRPSVSQASSASSISKGTNGPALAAASNGTNGTAANGADRNGTGGPSTPKPRPRPSSINLPAIAPRTNKSAALRAAKQAEEEEKAKAALAKKARFMPKRILKAISSS